MRNSSPNGYFTFIGLSWIIALLLSTTLSNEWPTCLFLTDAAWIGPTISAIIILLDWSKFLKVPCTYNLSNNLSNFLKVNLGSNTGKECTVGGWTANALSKLHPDLLSGWASSLVRAGYSCVPKLLDFHFIDYVILVLNFLTLIVFSIDRLIIHWIHTLQNTT